MDYRDKKDLPIVRVLNGDFETAFRIFNRKVRNAGIFGLLQDRRLRPTGAMRRRHKRHKAMARIKR